MSQDFTLETYTASGNYSADMLNIEDNFAALKSSFSGVSAPGAGADSPVAGQFWFDTTKKIMKIRNTANNAWLGMFYGNASFKVWMYLNSANDGWLIDSSITDKVVAIKGGSTYVTGGVSNVGTWVITGNTLSTAGSTHTHKMFDWISTTVFKSWEANGTTPETIYGGQRADNQQMGKSLGDEPTASYRCLTEDIYVNSADGSHTHSLTSGGAWRPTAAVGILVAPNM